MNFGEMFNNAYALSMMAKVVARCILALAQIVHLFAKITPHVFHSAVAFRKFVDFVDQLQSDRYQDLKQLVKNEEELIELKKVSYCKEDHDDLKAKHTELEKKYNSLYWKQ